MSDRMDKWLRAVAPEVPDSAPHKARLRQRLREKLDARHRRRRRWRQIGVLAASLALVAVFSGQITDLGSDSFEVVDTIKTSDGGTMVAVGHQRTWIKLKEDGSPGYVRENVAQIVANEGVVELLMIVRIGEGVHSNIARATVIDGEKISLTNRCKDIPNNTTDEIAEFMMHRYDDFLARISTVPGPPGRGFRMRAEGHLFECREWIVTYPDLGRVTVIHGTVIDKP